MSAFVIMNNHAGANHGSAAHEHQHATDIDVDKRETMLISAHDSPGSISSTATPVSKEQLSTSPREGQRASSTASELQPPGHTSQSPSKTFMPASVEDCTDEEDHKVEHNSVMPPSNHGHVTESHEVDNLGNAANNYSVSTSGPLGDNQLEDPSSQHHTVRQSIPRRPSVMDYLVSGVNTSSESTPLATDPGTPNWESSDDDSHSHQTKKFTWPRMDNKYQDNWSTIPQQGSHIPPVSIPISPNYNAPPYQPAYNHPYPQLHSPAANPPPPPASVVGSQHPLRYMHPEAHIDAHSIQKTPLRGYQLLAAKLADESGGTPIKPIYRRFEALNHRILLYLQDDISQLESQLTDIEAKDTAERTYSGMTLTASRRQERYMNVGFSQQKVDILGSIGFKLKHYNEVLASVRSVESIPAPSWRDVQAYKDYLFAEKPIVEEESRFLDCSTDLLCLSADSQTAADAATPMPREPAERQFPPSMETNQLALLDANLIRLIVLGIWAAILPMVLFAFVPTYFGRMTLLAALCTTITIAVDSVGVQPEGKRGKMNLVYSGLYFGSMAVIAHALS